MTKQETELHEKFLKGITLKMIIWGVALVGSAVSSFWAGVYHLSDKIDDNNNRIDRVQFATTKRQDSLQSISDLSHKDIWNAIDSKVDKTLYKGGFVTESYPNGRRNKPILHSVE